MFFNILKEQGDSVGAYRYLLFSIVYFFFIAAHAFSIGETLGQYKSKMNETFQSVKNGAQNFLDDTSLFDPTRANEIRNQTLTELRERQQQNLQLINDPQVVAGEKTYIKWIEERRSNTCNVAGEIKNLIIQSLEKNCDPALVIGTCANVNTQVNHKVSELGLTPEQVNRKLHESERANILTEMIGFRDRIFKTLKYEIYPRNQSCYELMSEKFGSDRCLNAIDEVMNGLRKQQVVELCTEESVNSVFDEFIGIMQSSDNPFHGILRLQADRMKARQTEFEVAKMLITVDDAVKAWENSGRAPTNVRISPVPQSRPASLQGSQ